MSQKYKLKQDSFEVLRFKSDMDPSELIKFVGDKAVVVWGSDGTALGFNGPYDADDMIELEEDDYLVRIFDTVEVFADVDFADQFV